MNEVHGLSNPTPGPRQRRREEKTRALLDDAASIVVDAGMAALTMPALAKRAGVAVGGLYRYFDSKAALIAELQLAAVNELDDYLREVEIGAGLSAVRSTVLGVRTFRAARPTQFLLLDLAVSDPHQLLDDASAVKVTAALEPILARVEAMLGDAVAAREIVEGDGRQRTLALWGVVFGILHLGKMDARRPRPELRHDHVLTMVLDDLFRGWSQAR